MKTVAESLQHQADIKNMTVNHNLEIKDSYKCCVDKLECCRFAYWYQVNI